MEFEAMDKDKGLIVAYNNLQSLERCCKVFLSQQIVIVLQLVDDGG